MLNTNKIVDQTEATFAHLTAKHSNYSTNTSKTPEFGVEIPAVLPKYFPGFCMCIRNRILYAGEKKKCIVHANT